MFKSYEKEQIEHEKLRLKRLLKKLEKKVGRGTELISLYIPPGRRISDVMRYLRQEYSTSANIKSDLTRKNVQNAIVKVMERLKLFKETPETGLVIFCGAIPQNGGPGSERMEIYTIIPPEPIKISLYRCYNRFYLEPLKELLQEKEVYGLISMDVEEAAIAILEGSSIKMVSKHTSGIPGKHRAGGQSARRFERLREMEIKEYFRRVAEHANQVFLSQDYADKLSGIIIGGPGFTKNEFGESKYLDYRIKEKIIGYIDLNYAGEEGIREMIEKAKGLLKETKYLREKRLVDEFIREISRGEGLAIYGLKNVWKAIHNRSAKIVLILENFEGYVIIEKCPHCGFFGERVSVQKPTVIREGKCPVCKRGVLTREVTELIDYLDEKSKEMGFELKVISAGTEHGKEFKQFGGIAAFMKYRSLIS